MMHSSSATNLIQSFESCRLIAYLDTRGIWTIGWGHTGHEVKEGLSWTQEQADQQLNTDIGEVDLALQCGLGVDVNQNQWDALTSFVFNVGSGAFETSTLRKCLLKNDFVGASAEFPKWCHNHDGTVNDGLLRRRYAEKVLFDREVI
jgi:lysozyme